MTCHHYQKHVGQNGFRGEGRHGESLLGIFNQQGAVSHGGNSNVNSSLKQEAALSVDVDHLTSDPSETLRDLNVHRQLQAERMMSSIKVINMIYSLQSLIGSCLFT